MQGLHTLRRPEDVAKLRGISVREVLGVGTADGAPAEEAPGTESAASDTAANQAPPAPLNGEAPPEAPAEAVPAPPGPEAPKESSS
jgi:hypothetical protein